MDRRAIRLASLESQFVTVPLGAALDGWARLFGKSHTPTRACRRSRLIMGDAGWEDRFSDPGRPKAASRRGRSPQEAALFFPLTGAGSAAPVDHAASVPKIRTSCSIWRDAGG